MFGSPKQDEVAKRRNHTLRHKLRSMTSKTNLRNDFEMKLWKQWHTFLIGFLVSVSLKF